MSRRTRRILLAVACLWSLSWLAGCAVAPWQREHLADPVLRYDEDPESRVLDLHYLDNREGTAGGGNAVGGGCGC